MEGQKISYPCGEGIPKTQRRWAFSSALEAEEMKQLSVFPGPSEDPSVVELLKVKEQQLPITSTTDVEDSLILSIR